MRSLIPLLCLGLAACSSIMDQATVEAISPPEQAKVETQMRAVAVEGKLAEPLEISSVREADPIAPGRYIVCVRGAPSEKNQRYTYAAFFRNNDFVSSRMSIIMDSCENQIFTPLGPPKK